VWDEPFDRLFNGRATQRVHPVQMIRRGGNLGSHGGYGLEPIRERFAIRAVGTGKR
jgi:hypothetical protein